MPVKNMVVLFDESGTPAISNDQRTDWFIGVGVAYQQSDEKSIFARCEADFGLSNSKPLKNYRIGTSRVIRMAKLLTGLPLSVYVSAVNTANPTLRNIIIKYESFGAKARRNFRQIRKRPIPQIIHSHVLDHCLFNIITGYFEEDGSDAAFTVFIDDWSIPENDIYISLEHRAKSLYEKISPLCANFTKGRLVSIAPLELLNKDSVRKRFVDGVASTFNRAYLNPNNKKYSICAVEVLKNCKRAQCGEATQHSINIMQRVMKGAPDGG
ncbi:MAG: hypothetical protein HWN68_19245 [Desulfobacterales bacterium]|nr:hypothetical protein [Desulfobacterales bacterium]